MNQSSNMLVNSLTNFHEENHTYQFSTLVRSIFCKLIAKSTWNCTQTCFKHLNALKAAVKTFKCE